MTFRLRLGALILFVVVAGTTVLYAEESGNVNILVGRSTIVDVGAPIARVSLTSPDVADALVTSPAQLLLHGKTPGTISMFIWDKAGAIRRYDVTVQRDLSRLSSQVLELFPGEHIAVQGNGRSVIVSGTASSKFVMEKAVEVAAGYVDKKEDVVNLLQVEANPPSQVLLHVRFAEVSRSALTELGASIFTSALGIKNTLARTTTQQFPAPNYEELTHTKSSSDFGSDVTSASGKITFSDFLNVFLFSEKYDLGRGASPPVHQRHVPEPRRAEPGDREREGSELSGRRRDPRSDCPGHGRQRGDFGPVEGVWYPAEFHADRDAASGSILKCAPRSARSTSTMRSCFRDSVSRR